MRALYAERHGQYREVPAEWPLLAFADVGLLLIERGIVGQIDVGASHWFHLRGRALVETALAILAERPEIIEKSDVEPYSP